jgi:hypothetical protein
MSTASLSLFKVDDGAYEWWVKAASPDVVLTVLFRDYGCSLDDLGDGTEDGIVISPVTEEEARAVIITDADDGTSKDLWSCFLEEDHEHMVATSAPF